MAKSCRAIPKACGCVRSISRFWSTLTLDSDRTAPDRFKWSLTSLRFPSRALVRLRPSQPSSHSFCNAGKK